MRTFMDLMVRRYGAKKVGSKECKIVCIYHDDNNPSLQVNTENGIFHCWTCKERGRASKLIADLENITEVEADEILKEFGFQKATRNYQKTGSNSYQFKKQIIKPLDENVLSAFYPLRLNSYVSYLESRGIDLKTAQKYGFKEGIPSDNTWRNRIVYPIRDVEGHLFAVKGRSINPKAELRYWQEGELGTTHGLFGASQIVEKRKRKIPYVVITEGVFDSLSFTLNNEFSVALNGTSITDFQINQIKRITDTPVIVLDGLKDNKVNTVNTRKDMINGFNKMLSKHFSRYLIHTINREKTDPNNLHVAGKLGKYFTQEIKNKKEFKSLFA